MKPAPFDYYAPDSVAEAVALLERLEDDDVDAKVLAGGQSLMPMLAIRVARPDALVDLRKLTDLNYIRQEGDVIAIGAMTSKSAAEDSQLLKEKQPLMHAASALIGHRQIRNRGTVGGSFAHADPSAEYGAAAIVLDIEMVAVGPDGERTISADEFYITFLTTDLDSMEILTEVRIPLLAEGTGWSFQEKTRRTGDLAMAGVAITLNLEAGCCANSRIVVFGIGAVATRQAEAEQMINGKPPSDELFAEAAAIASQAMEEPITDVHASADYRRQLVKSMIASGLVEAVSRAAG
jgi:carbon-monoxide dehydrogenase medium subunit